MATSNESEAARVKRWMERIRAANTVYDRWAERFNVARLERYYEGEQHHRVSEEEARQRYTINLIAASLETQKPSLLFYKPKFAVEPRPSRLDDLGAASAQEAATLSAQTIQTLVDDPDSRFQLETQLGVHEAHFRFGVVEVGYTADFIDNPTAGKPVLQERDPKDDPAAVRAVQPDQIVKTESIYLKRIPAKHFRVSDSGRNDLASNDWCGYCEYHYIEDVKRNKKYKNTAKLRSTRSVDKQLRDEVGDPEERERRYGMVCLWKIWDLRTHERHVLVEGHDKFLLSEAYAFLPFADLKFLELPDRYYPKPPIADWIGPQDEFNDIREGQRVHRERFKRRYTALLNAIDDPELEKLLNGPDGTVAIVKQQGALVPVMDAPLDGSVNNPQAAMTDFITASGVTGEQRGVAESETATQANILDVRARIRESSARTKVADWLGRIGRLVLVATREHMSLPFWIQAHTSPTSGLEAVVKAAQAWVQITAQDLGDMDMQVSVDLASLSPVTQDAQLQAWLRVLQVLTNPGTMGLFALSEPMLRKTLELNNITSEQDVQDIFAAVRQLGQMQALQAGNGGQMPDLSGLAGAMAPGGGGLAQVDGMMGTPEGGPDALALQLEQQG